MVGGIVITDRHVHHFNFGIGLLTAAGGVAAVHGQESARRHSVTAAAYYGTGAGAGAGAHPHHPSERT